MCCTHIEVQALNKPAGRVCQYACDGCTIYDRRPEQCAGFDCLWMVEPSLPEALWPKLCGVFFEPFWDERMVVAMVDPTRPKVWMNGAGNELISQMVHDGYIVWVMVGADRHLLLPDGVSEEEGHEQAKRAWERKVWPHQPIQLI